MMMARGIRFVALSCAVLLTGNADAQESRTASVGVHVAVRSHTELRVSSSELRFEVTGAVAEPELAIDFVAAARTCKGGSVVLSVESAGTIQTPDGSPSGDLTIGYRGEGQSGTISAAEPNVAGQWIDGGVREGRLLFKLRGARMPGTYLVPLKFVLSTP